MYKRRSLHAASDREETLLMSQVMVVDIDGADHLIFKHAIATIATERSIANYFAAPRA